MTGQDVTECTGGVRAVTRREPARPLSHRLRPAAERGAGAGARVPGGRDAAPAAAGAARGGLSRRVRRVLVLAVRVLAAAAGLPDDAAARRRWRRRGMAAGAPRRLAASAVEIGFAGRGAATAGGRRGATPTSCRRRGGASGCCSPTWIRRSSASNASTSWPTSPGVKPQVAAITEAAMRGELDFEAALTARVALLEGLPEAVLQACYDARVRLNPGARALVRTMAALGPTPRWSRAASTSSPSGWPRRRASRGTGRTGCWSRTAG